MVFAQRVKCSGIKLSLTKAKLRLLPTYIGDCLSCHTGNGEALNHRKGWHIRCTENEGYIHYITADTKGHDELAAKLNDGSNKFGWEKLKAKVQHEANLRPKDIRYSYTSVGIMQGDEPSQLMSMVRRLSHHTPRKTIHTKQIIMMPTKQPNRASNCLAPACTHGRRSEPLR